MPFFHVITCFVRGSTSMFFPFLIPVTTHAANTNGHTSVVLNAGVNNLFASGPGFFVNPVQSLVGSANLAYNAVTKEIYVASSSRRYKMDIQEVSASESAGVWDLRPVSYPAIHTANDDDNSPVYYGFIAEEVAEVDPRLSFWGLDADGLPQVEGVNYDQVVPLLLQEAKQLKAETMALKAARENDSAEIAALKAETVALKAARENDSAEIAALKSAREKDSAEIAALQARNAEMEKKVELLYAKLQ